MTLAGAQWDADGLDEPSDIDLPDEIDGDALDEETGDGEETDEWNLLDAARGYAAASPADREAGWLSLTDEQRDELRSIGVSGPITVDEADELPPVETMSAAVLVRMNAELASGLADARRGTLDLSPATYERIEDLTAEADALPNGPDRTRLLQQAHEMLTQARTAAADAIPFMPSPLNPRTERRMPDGTYRLVETDMRGQTKVTVLSGTSDDQDARPIEDTDPGAVTLEEVASWGVDRIIRFRKNHPERFEQLKQDESDMRTRAQHAQLLAGYSGN